MRRGKFAFISSFFLVLVLAISIVGAQDTVYVIPDAPDDVNLDTVIAHVDDVEITLDDFVKRYRFERFRAFSLIKDVYDDAGPNIFDFEAQDNPYAAGLSNFFDNVVNPEQFAGAIYEGLIIENLYHQEIKARDITIEQCEIDKFWSNQLGVMPVSECEFPEGFAESKAEFIQTAQTFSGLSESEIEAVIVSLAEVSKINEIVGAEFEIPEDRTVITRHIRVSDETVANEVFSRLQDGEDFDSLLLEFSEDPGIEGNNGDLGYFSSGQMVPDFEDAVFNGEIGEIVGPIQTQFGYHVIEILDKQNQIRARHILLDNEEDAKQAVRLLENGTDFAELAIEYSLDMGSKPNGGDLGFFGRGQMVPEFDQAVFDAEVGEIVGPVQTEFGYHVIEVTEISPEISQAAARHILLLTEDEANAVIERLQSGEDFATLAGELSIDPSSSGHGGNTWAVITGGQETGAYAESDILGILPELLVSFEAQPGDVLEPIQTAYGYFIVVVDEFSTRPPSFENAAFMREMHAIQWRDEQLDSDRVESTELWREYMPEDPIAVDVYPELAIVDTLLDEAKVRYEEDRAATTIINILKTLQAPTTD